MFIYSSVVQDWSSAGGIILGPELLKGGSSHPGVGAFVLGQKLRGEKMSLGRKLPRSSCPGGGHVL